MMRIAALVLAAGRSSRFKSGNKLKTEIDGVPLVRRVLMAAAASPVAEILLVTNSDAQHVAAAAGTGRWRPIVNNEAHLGLATSLRTGIAALPDTTAGALVVLADMPGISTDLITRVIDEFAAQRGGAIVHPVDSAGRQGHPVLWPKSLFPELLALEGDSGGKALLQKYTSNLHTVAANGAEAFLDIDTDADLARYKGAHET